MNVVILSFFFHQRKNAIGANESLSALTMLSERGHVS